MPAQVESIARVHHQRMGRAPGYGLRRVDHHAAGQQPLAHVRHRRVPARRVLIGKHVFVPAARGLLRRGRDIALRRR